LAQLYSAHPLLSVRTAQNRVVTMAHTQNPIKRVFKPKAPVALPVRAKFDIYGNDLPHQDAHEKNSDSIWSTFDALQAAEAERIAKLKRK
jgi:hypothetical protein